MDFINWISKPVPEEELKIWFSVNNIVYERSELYKDFCVALMTLINDTYFGDKDGKFETEVEMSDEDNMKHFDWCWNKTIENFEKENITFLKEGSHKIYFKSFIADVYYNQTNQTVKKSVTHFLNDIFSREIGFSKSDLDLFTEIYKLMDSNVVK
jgi:hypothetical protein